jgi:hypothetical protein
MPTVSDHTVVNPGAQYDARQSHRAGWDDDDSESMCVYDVVLRQRGKTTALGTLEAREIPCSTSCSTLGVLHGAMDEDSDELMCWSELFTFEGRHRLWRCYLPCRANAARSATRPLSAAIRRGGLHEQGLLVCLHCPIERRNMGSWGRIGR